MQHYSNSPLSSWSPVGTHSPPTHTNTPIQIPKEVGQLLMLGCLDISHNREIRSLPDEMGNLEHLFMVGKLHEVSYQLLYLFLSPLPSPLSPLPSPLSPLPSPSVEPTRTEEPLSRSLTTEWTYQGHRELSQVQTSQGVCSIACMRVCVGACACVCACVRMCACACMCVCVCVHVYVYVLYACAY